MLKTLFTCFLFIVLLPHFHALGDNSSAIQDYGEKPNIIDIELSPDGQTIAYVRRTAEGEFFLVFNLDGEELIKIKTDSSKSRDIQYLSNDAPSFVIGQTISKGYREKFEASYRLAVSIENNTGSVLQKGAYGGLGQTRLDIVMASNDQYAFMPAYERVGQTSSSLGLFAVPLRGGRNGKVATGDRNTTNWFYHLNSRILIREDTNDRGDEQSLHVISDGATQTIYGPALPLGTLGLSTTGQELIALQYREGEDFPDLIRFPLNGEEMIVVSLSASLEYVFKARDGSIRGLQFEGMTPSYLFFDDQLDAHVKDFQGQYPDASVWFDSADDSGKNIIFRIESSDESGRYVLHKRETNTEIFLGHIREGISSDQVAKFELFRYQSRDGLDITAILTSPHESDATTPLIIMPHGGPAAYDSLHFDWMAQYFARKGYKVLQPNFRGSTGFGESFERRGDGEWGKAMQDDLEDGITALVQAGLTDGNQVCIVGASYGGYAALAGGAFQPNLYQCVVAIAPVSDLNLMMATERKSFGRNHWVVSYWERAITDGERRRKLFDAISPVKFADKFQVPVLLVHGKDDTVVPIKQSRRMAKALKRAKRDYQFVEIKDGDHWLLNGDARHRTLQTVDTFLDQHLPVDRP